MSELRQAQGVVNLVAHFLTIFQLRHPASIYGHFHLVDLQQGWGRLTTLLFRLSIFFWQMSYGTKTWVVNGAFAVKGKVAWKELQVAVIDGESCLLSLRVSDFGDAACWTWKSQSLKCEVWLRQSLWAFFWEMVVEF